VINDAQDLRPTELLELNGFINVLSSDPSD
jgi:hypothetical protein